jgi:hypothetical protein
MSSRQQRIVCAAGVLAVAALVAPAAADNLTGASAFLCAPMEATVCTPEGGCETGPPFYWNIPSFIIVDLERLRLTTTEASGEDRLTPIKNLERDADQIYLQGIELGRAFSFVIDEDTGMASFAVARPGMTVTAFGACTPGYTHD